MRREAYEVHATLVDANGVISIDPTVEGTKYPQIVDSKLYNNDTDKALKRAMGILGSLESAFSTQDTRQVQYGYIVRVNDGTQIEKRIFGGLHDLPDSE